MAWHGPGSAGSKSEIDLLRQGLVLTDYRRRLSQLCQSVPTSHTRSVDWKEMGLDGPRREWEWVGQLGLVVK